MAPRINDGFVCFLHGLFVQLLVEQTTSKLWGALPTAVQGRSFPVFNKIKLHVVVQPTMQYPISTQFHIISTSTY